jgi:hypothetical protein
MILASFCSGSSGPASGGEDGKPAKDVKIAGARENGFSVGLALFYFFFWGINK